MAIVEGYATLAEVKKDLRLTTTTDDERIERCVEAASRLVDHLTHRRWVTDSGAQRVFTPSGCTVWVDDAQAVTTVEESNDQTTWTAVASTAWVTNPRLPIRYLERTSGADWFRFVRILGDWGSGAIPPEINEATRIEAVRLFKRPDTPEGVLVGDFGAARLARVDPDVLALCRIQARPVVG